MGKTPKVFIVILNWNRPKDILECLESVHRMNYENYAVIIVDNGCEDGSCETIKKTYPGVDLIKNTHNLGYAGGNNVGMRLAMERGADYIWLLNDDTTVSPDCLKLMIEVAEGDNEIGLVSPIVYYFENPSKWQFAGSYINWKPFIFRFPDRRKEIGEEYQKGGNVCLFGTALLIKRKLIQKIGYLKYEYFAYWEDTEYSLRSLRGGFKNVVCKSSSVFHKGQVGGSDGAKRGKHYYYFMVRNKKFLGDEYIRKAIDRLSFNIRYFAEVSDYVGRYEKEYLDACMDGAWHGMKGITGSMSDKDKMPYYLKKLLLSISRYHPVFFADLITLKLKEISRRISMR